MKITIVIFFLVCASWQTDARSMVVTGRILNADGLNQYEEACINELNLDRQKMVGLNKQLNPPEDDTEFCDFTFCSFKKIGLMTEGGDFNYEEIERFIIDVIKNERPVTPPTLKLFESIISNSIGECRKNPPAGTNHGQSAIKMMTCITQNAQQALRRMKTL